MKTTIGLFALSACMLSASAEEIDIDRLCPPRPETAARFEPGAYPAPTRTYREAAAKVYEYMTALPAMTALVETGRPHQKYQHNAYVAKTHAAHIRAMLRWAKLDPSRREKAMRFARASAEFLLGELEPAGAPLAYWPPTYGRKPLEFDPKTDGPYNKPAMIGNEPEGAVKYRGEVMLVYPSAAGTAFLDYFEATKDARFLEAAKRIGETYLNTRRPDGSWPLKMKLATGEAIGENTLVPNQLLPFFERLFGLTNDAAWRTAADKVFAWLEDHPLKDWNWDGQFEDIRPEKPYRNPTKHNACDVLMYMLERFPGDKARLVQCRRLLEFCEKRFVVWKTPANHPGWPAPSVLEQYSCFTPIDASASKMIRTYVAMYRAEGRVEDLLKARALADTLTRQQLPSGRIPTFWDEDSGLTGERYDWLNCMAASAEALLTVDAVAPSQADIKGPFPILSTPYFEDGRVDYEALAREVKWVASCGCPGAIWCQSNDAIDLLTHEEKFLGFEACAKAAEGLDITLTLGANGTNTAEMIEIAREIERVAKRHPATRIAIASRPPDDSRTEADLEAAWDALAAVVRRPVIQQTYGTSKTPTPSVELLARLGRRHPHAFGYVKEEAGGFGAVTRMREENANRPWMKSVFAGWGGWQWLIQLRQVGCEGLVTERAAFAPILSEIWRRYKKGERGLRLTEAYAMYRLLVDQRNFPAGLRGYPLYYLCKEGVFRNCVSREYSDNKVTEGGSFGVGHSWKLTRLELNDIQKAELDLLYDEMLEYCGMSAAK